MVRSVIATRKQGILHAHLAALLFGGTALFAKLIPLAADVITFWRTVVAMFVMWLLCRLTGRSMKLERRRDVYYQIGLGAMFGIHWATYYASIQVSTVAIGITSLFVAPVLSVLIEAVMRREWPNVVDLLLCGVVFLGVLCLIPNFDWNSGYLKGVVLGVISALFLALRQNLHHRSRAKNSSSLVLLFYQLIGIAVLFAYAGVGVPQDDLKDNWVNLLLLGVFFTAIPHFLNVSALRELEAKSVLIITSLMVPYGIVLGLFFLDEVPAPRTLIGCLLVMLAATAENLRMRR
ncbi:MAG TPA: EamA family transporter [Opitutae bacterium]|nr:EamA family transporter [Puniceicoccaceae bacterium]HBR95150.1 EamA family transporter [Opitutae bacterium]|tara:strand:+ start:1205 stop:2077 length:873 start_codon:yes stop_codon:yes gene_type:complete